jgi:hypothetical protein
MESASPYSEEISDVPLMGTAHGMLDKGIEFIHVIHSVVFIVDNES